MFSLFTVYPLYGMRNAEGLGRFLHPAPNEQSWPQERYRFGTWETGVDLQFPSHFEWRYLQPSETRNPDDWWDPDFHMTVPPCLVVTIDFEPDEPSGVPNPNLVKGIQREVHMNARAALRSLRLLRAGWFCDPALTEHITMNSWQTGELIRHLGAYRYAFHDEEAHKALEPPEAPFEVAQRDFELADNSGSPLRELQALSLVAIEQAVGSLELALQAFERCAGIGLSWAQRFLLISSGLSAALGDDQSNARAVVEAVHAKFVGSGGKDAASWLFDDFRSIRNAAAHGRQLALGHPDRTYQHATELLRWLLIDQLRYVTTWSAQRADRAERAFLPDYRRNLVGTG